MSTIQHRTLTLSLLALLASACGAEVPQVPQSSMVSVAQGRYSTKLVAGEKPPSDEEGKPAVLKVTSDFSQVPTTNEWWSSLIWRFRKDATQYSEEMFPHPLSFKAVQDGFEIGYTTEPVVTETNYEYPHKADLVLGVAGLAAPDARVSAYSDWTVTAELRDASHALRATLGHGLPYVYLSSVTGNARVTAVDTDLFAAVKSREGNVVALEVRGHHYALFAPPGTSWEIVDNALTADLRGGDYYSAAVLPDNSAETLALFTKYAFNFVTDTKVSFRFDPQQGRLVSKFDITTEDKTKKAPGIGTLFALYRHQWKSSATPVTGKSYVSPRGEMKLAEGKGFDVSYPLGTLLPALPGVGDISRGRLKGMLKVASKGDLFPKGLEGTRDSYWEGKSFGRNSDLLYIAQQQGNTRVRDRLLKAIKAELEDWFDGQNPRYCYYDETWHTLIGIPSMYFSGSMMNDHHFHYAYFIYAAATVAQFDPAWAKKWAPLVELLIRDAGNWDREDKRFPFMRNFDVYAGHSWAGGTTLGPRGNNEESSSEDVNFAGAVALWGEVMGQNELRDAGLFMYTSLVHATEQYWFDVDDEVYPKDFQHPSVGIVWGNGGLYDTWFSYLPPFIHGIQLTPFSIGSLWFGRNPANIERNLQHLKKTNDGDVHIWRELFWMMEALQNPKRAAKRFEDEHWFEPELGNTLAHTYQVLSSLEELGTIEQGISADVPFYAVFKGDRGRSYVAFNGSAEKRTIRFSDGTTLDAAPRALATKRP